MSRQNRGRRVIYDKTSELYKTYVQELLNAYRRGYSVIELQRILYHKDSRNLYATMRDAEMFPCLQRKRQKKYEVPAAFAKALGDCNLSFLQWCNSRAFEPGMAAEMLCAAEIKGNRRSEAVHEAYRRDFGNLYAKVYKTEFPTTSTLGKLIPEKRTTHSLSIIFDDIKLKYCATIPEIPACCAEGETWDEAFDNMKACYVLHVSIIKLKLLPSREEIND